MTDQHLQQRYKEAKSIARQFMEPLRHIIQAPLPGSSMVARYKNIYCNLDGTLSPTPFKMPREGIWYFDGQVFYQK